MAAEWLVALRWVTPQTAFDFIQVIWPSGGEGGIRTHGRWLVTRLSFLYHSGTCDRGPGLLIG